MRIQADTVKAIEGPEVLVFFNGYQIVTTEKPKQPEPNVDYSILPHKRISKRCTRLSTEFQIKMQDQN
jgi:hypothetical protein